MGEFWREDADDVTEKFQSVLHPNRNRTMTQRHAECPEQKTAHKHETTQQSVRSDSDTVIASKHLVQKDNKTLQHHPHTCLFPSVVYKQKTTVVHVLCDSPIIEAALHHLYQLRHHG